MFLKIRAGGIPAASPILSAGTTGKLGKIGPRFVFGLSDVIVIPSKVGIKSRYARTKGSRCHDGQLVARLRLCTAGPGWIYSRHRRIALGNRFGCGPASCQEN